MATTGKTPGRKVAAKKPAGGITKAKVKRVARKTQAALEVAAHDAGLALRRTARKVKRTAQKLETRIEESKGPAKQTAQRMKRKVTSALERASELITTTGHKAKLSFNAARKAFVEAPTPAKPAPKKRSTAKPVAKTPAARRKAAP